MGIFGKKKPKGAKIRSWDSKHKCFECKNDTFYNFKYYDGKRFDRVKAECAKCGSSYSEEGPFHESSRKSRKR